MSCFPINQTASMIEGIGHSRAQTRVFAHNDPTDLDPNAPKLVAFESVYSMDGDIAPIAEICDVAEAHGVDALVAIRSQLGLAQAAQSAAGMVTKEGRPFGRGDQPR